MKIDSVRFDSVTISSCPHGEVVFDTPGTFSWVAPAGVTSISAVVIGGGGGGSASNFSGGGGGGGLGWKNSIPVVPGQSYAVVVGASGPRGAAGGDSYFISTGTVFGGGGKTQTAGPSPASNQAFGGTFVGDGGGIGGPGGFFLSGFAGYVAAGGGAGGYAGTGGVGGANSTGVGGAGTGGSAGGGGTQTGVVANTKGGGGVGIYGQGANGAAGIGTSLVAGPGGGGSGGTPGSGTNGGNYGGGAAGSEGGAYSSVGGGGAVRIIWGTGRSFPSTNVGPVADYGFGLPNPVNTLNTLSLQASYDPQDPASFPGTTAYNDISGNGWNGTFAVSPTRDTQATVTFNGSTQIATIPDATSQLGGYNSSTGLSYVMWVKVNSLAAIQYIFDKRNTGITAGVSLLVLTNGTIQAQNAGSAYSVSTTALVTGTWYNIVVTFNTSQIVSYYINNSSAQNGGGVGAISNSVTPLKIGATANNSSLFNGQIGQFAVYRTTLTATDVDYIYKTTKWRYGL
jgi:hypothetical protein